jgi:hypothetical protein
MSAGAVPSEPCHSCALTRFLARGSLPTRWSLPVRRHVAESLGPMFILTNPITHSLEPQAGETTAIAWGCRMDVRRICR